MQQQIDLFGELPVPHPEPAATRVTPSPSRKPDWRSEVECRQPQLVMDDPEFDHLFRWSDDEIIRMRVGLLWSSIRDVCDGRLSEWAREEVWDWIEDDEIWAFSFRVCVAEYDPRIDPEDLREAVRVLSVRLLSGESGYRIDEQSLAELCASL